MGVWPSYVPLSKHLIGAKIKREGEKQPLQDAVWVLPNYNYGLICKLEVFWKMKTNCMPWFRHFLQCKYLLIVFFTSFSKEFPVKCIVFSKFISLLSSCSWSRCILTVCWEVNLLREFPYIYFKSILYFIQYFSVLFIGDESDGKTFCAKTSSSGNLM